jgi:ATP-dependent Lon protease
MPVTKPNSKNKESPKRRVKRRGGKGGKDDDDSSVDSRGNIRNLIDYDYTSDDDESYVPPRSRKNKVVKRSHPSPSPKESVAKKEKPSNKVEYKVKEKESTRLTPSKRKFPFKSASKKHNSKRRSPPSSESSNESHFKLDNYEVDSEEYEYTNRNKHSKKYVKESTDEEDEDEEEYEEEDELEEEEEEEDNELEEDEEEEEKLDEEEDEYDEEDEDYEEDEEDSKQESKGFGGILLTLGGGPSSNASMIPKKYNMKKEPEIVKKFVKLLTSPVEENTIDTQITQFKALNEEKQKELITSLENRPTANDTGVSLMLKILSLRLPPDVQAMILSKYNSLQNLDTSSNEYFKLRAWLDKVVSIPFGTYKDIPIRIDDGPEKCAEFMKTAKKCLDDAAYGQEESKLQIMQFISTKIANPEHRGLSLLFVGPPGIGKTSIIKNGIAKALGWPFQFISLGGDSDASTYTGHQLVYESSHCGKIVNSLVASKSMSTVLMFDEVDKISQTPKGEEVMNLLIHLTDPVQNGDFEDKYLAGVPIDLSKVMFVFSANDITKIDKVLLDRMMVIDLKGYDVKQKTTIAEQYLLPSALKDVNLNERVAISKDILTSIVEEYASEEKGVRELKRCIEQITQKINMLRMYNSPELPFHIKDFALPFIVKKEHIKLFLKKKEGQAGPPQGMYM